MDRSPVLGVYDEDIDRESAFEMLAAKAKQASDGAASKQAQDDLDPDRPTASGSSTGGWTLPGFGGDEAEEAPKGKRGSGRSGYQRETVVEAALKSVARTVATQLGQALVRGILGSLKR